MLATDVAFGDKGIRGEFILVCVFVLEDSSRMQIERQDVRNIGVKEERKEKHLNVTCLHVLDVTFASLQKSWG